MRRPVLAVTVAFAVLIVLAAAFFVGISALGRSSEKSDARYDSEVSQWSSFCQAFVLSPSQVLGLRPASEPDLVRARPAVEAYLAAPERFPTPIRGELTTYAAAFNGTVSTNDPTVSSALQALEREDSEGACVYIGSKFHG
jgi:hypothetical protein